MSASVIIEQLCACQAPHRVCFSCMMRNKTMNLQGTKRPFYVMNGPKGFGMNLCPNHLQDRIAQATLRPDGSHGAFLLKRPPLHDN